MTLLPIPTVEEIREVYKTRSEVKAGQRMSAERKAELKRTFKPMHPAEVVYELIAFLDEAENAVDVLRAELVEVMKKIKSPDVSGSGCDE